MASAAEIGAAVQLSLPLRLAVSPDAPGQETLTVLFSSLTESRASSPGWWPN